MTRPQLHFAHANSYPAGTYRQFFDLLGEHYRIQALDMHGHDPRYPVSTGWHELVQELIADLEQRYTEPVIMVGHSLGGMLSLMLAKARPDLVRCVVLLDAPVVAGWRAWFVRLARGTRWGESLSPARFSAKRRKLWPDAQAAYRHFAGKDLFAAWAPQVLRDYIANGLAPHPDGVQLRFTREIETQVYLGLPHHIGALVRDGLPVPIGFIGGSESVECRQAGLTATRKLVGRFFRQVPGGHLFPMESPRVAANEVHKMISALLST
ncbi:alpha/beta fold hydrolase [Janthinobacterium agaricidamnosum]|uniref:Putative hydrolase/acyltransferase n=1 Tax=Janthinobacterium agaricidamnosum NBRC 102515 = DSM 9628 TaxID=1349767 RepID=W0V1Y1_9BURK|nr:alpha/beta hydrolase [Janthinobacterium agaricidamnosum]CDG82834.1 putative hydrolase/acyltransferase [Janthinobacterium agaricidamnosum NBRC 102515 = DSM 9628]